MMTKQSLTKYLNSKSGIQLLTLGLCIAFALLIILTLSMLAWQWQLDWRLSHQQTMTSTQQIKPSASSSPQNQVAEEHIFGQSDVPVTDLSYRVTGTVKVDDDVGKTVSKAYISIDGQISKVYQVGDNISDGITVYGITPNEVILKNHGRLEKLPLPRTELEFKPVEQEDVP